MSEVIVAPDVESLLVSYLSSELAARLAEPGVKVSTKVPNPRPGRFVRVLLTGGAGRSSVVLESATVTVEAWGERETDAYSLAQLCRGLIHAIDVVNGVQFYRVEDFSAPANLPDPNSGQVRYTASYVVRVRGSAA